MDNDLKDSVMHVLLERFGKLRFDLPEDFMQKSHCERVIRNRLDWNSSPGYPYMRYATTNRDFFKVVDGVPSQQMIDYCWSLVEERLENKDSDYIRVFIKPEPHTWKKMKQHRYRLIMSVSVIDQIIDHMLFATMNDLMVDNYVSIPTKVGWSQFLGGWKLVPTSGVVSTDKSCWDWTVQPWLIEVLLDLRINLCYGRSKDRFAELAAWRYSQLYREAVFIFSNGRVLKQTFSGMQKSGSVLTISDNSIAQVILDARINEEFRMKEQPVEYGILWSMGDDVLQKKPTQKYIDRLSQLCILKQVEPFAEFAGMRFKNNKIEPCYHAKHCFNLRHLDPENDEAVAQSYSYLYYRSNYKSQMDKILLHLGPPPSDWSLRLVYDG